MQNSEFKKSGVLTPDEFILAGDFLVHHCPTWSWSVYSHTVHAFTHTHTHTMVHSSVYREREDLLYIARNAYMLKHGLMISTLGSMLS